MANINTEELNKVVRAMQDESLAKYKQANNYNALGAAIVQHGAEDKLKSRGWPINSPTPSSEKKVM